MKKASHLKLCIFLVALLALLTISLCACSKDKPVDKSTCYDIVATLDDGVLTARQEIMYFANMDSDCVALRIYANAFNAENDVITISNVKINSLAVDYDICGEDRTTLMLNHKMEKERSYLIYLEYVVNVGRRNARLGATSDGVTNLSCFYPIMAYCENGEWRTDEYSEIGDPFLSDAASYYVTLSLDEALEVACSGNITDTSQNDGVKTVEIVAQNVRDFAICVGKFQIAEDSVDLASGRVNVCYAYTTDKLATDTLARACSALKAFSEAFGDYPYDRFCFAQSRLGDAAGMEYGAFAIVESALPHEELLDAVTHEIAHQWWFGAVGNDQINHAWLDEGLAEFCTHYYHALIGQRQTFERAMADVSRAYSAFDALRDSVGFDGRMNRPLDTYLTSGEYAAVCYLKGALLFDTLRTVTGDENFLRALSDYTAANIFGVATPSSLAEAFDNVGVDIRPLLASWTEDKVI